ncbi:MAG TPA: hypothetical protein VIT68_01195 [Candidatus Gracilibacteria bacterium]
MKKAILFSAVLMALVSSTTFAASIDLYYRSQEQRQDTRRRVMPLSRSQRLKSWSPFDYNLQRCWRQVGNTLQHITGVDSESLCKTNNHEDLENSINWVGKYDPALFQAPVFGREALPETAKSRITRGFLAGRNTYVGHETVIMAKRKPHQLKTDNPEGKNAERTWTNAGDGDMSGLLKALRYRSLRK